ncbi:MAG: aminoacyl-tRNA hydrolase [Thermoanaerobaculia bacterium]|nr:aminoacyl-tRNA hydrolase [Thermoanaerobaculia bacterium]
MKLIVGLGNPGVEYEKTRHNAGFMVVDALAEKFRISLDTHEKDAMTGKGRVASRPVMLAKPLTYMNRSGESVLKLVNKHLGGTDGLDDLLIVFDDVDLDLGTLRIRERGSPGTHNGMRSLCDWLETERFPRLRFGVRGTSYSREQELADYVLEDFEQTEMEIVTETIERAMDAIVLISRGDLRRAMTQFNRSAAVESES